MHREILYHLIPARYPDIVAINSKKRNRLEINFADQTDYQFGKIESQKACEIAGYIHAEYKYDSIFILEKSLRS